MTEPNHALIAPIEKWIKAVDGADILKAPQDFLVGYGAVHRSLGKLLETADPQRAPNLLTALAACEFIMAEHPDFTHEAGLPPIQPLSADWLAVVDDGSPEFRLAASLSALRPLGLSASDDDATNERIRPLRSHLEPIDYQVEPSSLGWNFKASKDVVWDREKDVDGLNAIFSRRLESWDGSSSEFAHGAISARLSDIGAFMRGETDEAKLSRLCFELSLVEAWRLDRDPLATNAAAEIGAAEIGVDPAYALAKLCYSKPCYSKPCYSKPSYSGGDIPLNRDIHLLANRGDLDTALEFGSAHLRKHASGIDPNHDAISSDLDARRIAAALLFPLADSQLDILAATLDS
jgi:CRISPR-associated protein Csx17